MKDFKYIPNYKKYWEDEIIAHKYTIANNIEIRESVRRLIEANDKLVKLLEPLIKDREILLVKAFIKNLDNYTNEELVHIFKVALTRNIESKGLYTNLIKEIEKLRMKKGWIQELGSRGVSLDKTTEELKQSTKDKSTKRGAKK